MAKEKKTLFIPKPEYKGGPKELTKFIYANLRYPAEALNLGVEGVVYIEYGIDYQGNVIETKVLQGVGHGCDEEACRVVKLLKFDVGRTRGLHVLFHQKIKVQFKKPKQQAKAPQAPATSFQVNYTVTQATTPVAPEREKPQAQTFQYTIHLG
jgi:TonB family C-terminal domain